MLPTTMSNPLIRRAAALACILTALSTAGCVTRRTVTVNGETQSEKYVVKRPIRDALKDSGN